MKAIMSSSFRQRPATRLGQWAGGLAAAFVIMYAINSLVFMPTSGTAFNEALRQVFLPVYGISMMLCGLAAGITGFLAFFTKRERSWLVWLAILPGLFVVVFLLGEFLVPH